MTQKKKAVAVLLAVMLLFSALASAFCVSATEQTCTLKIKLYGDGSVSDGTTSAEAPSDFVAEYTLGQKVTLTATPGEDKETVFWVNAATNRVVSFSDTYVFSAGSDMELYIDFEDVQSVAAENGAHQVIYLSTGGNIVFNETLPLQNTTYYANSIASLKMFANGKTWTGWDKTPEEVAADSGRVIVRPTYDETVSSYTITSIIDGYVRKSQGTYGASFNLSAPATLNGEPFSYWLVLRDESDPNSQDQIASFTASYNFIVVMPMAFRAVYGEEVPSGAVTRVVGDVPEMDNCAITFYTEWNVSLAYSVVRGGMLYTTDPTIGNSESAFVLNAHDSRIREGTSSSTARATTYSVRVTRWYAQEDGATGEYYYPLRYVRSYLVVKDANGVVTTLYSPIHTADYVNEAFVGQIIDNPYDDPSQFNP